MFLWSCRQELSGALFIDKEEGYNNIFFRKIRLQQYYNTTNPHNDNNLNPSLGDALIHINLFFSWSLFPHLFFSSCTTMTRWQLYIWRENVVVFVFIILFLRLDRDMRRDPMGKERNRSVIVSLGEREREDMYPSGCLSLLANLTNA